MDRKKKIITLLGVLLALCCFWLVMQKENEEKIRANETEILHIETENIKEISWNKDGVDFSFYKKEGEWYSKNDEAFPVNEIKLYSILTDLNSVVSTFEISEVSDYAQYGLEEPTCVIDVVCEETYTIALGGYSSIDEQRYASVGNGNVYLLKEDLLESFSCSLSDLMEDEELPDMEDIISFSLIGKNSIEIIYEEDYTSCYSNQYSYYANIDGKYEPLDDSNTLYLINTIRNLSWLDCATYNVKEGELANYGLENPLYEVVIVYREDEEEKTFKMQIGKNGNEYYARIKDSKYVYLIDESVCEDLNENTYTLIRAQEVVLLDYSIVESIQFEIDGSDYEFEIDKEGEWLYKFNDEEGSFEDIKDKLDAFTITSFVDDCPSKPLELSLKVKQSRENYETIEITFYQYDGESCLVTFDGKTKGIVSREDVVDLKEAILKILL